MKKLLGNLYLHGLAFRPAETLTASGTTLKVPQAVCKITCSGTSVSLSTLTAGNYTGVLLLIADSSEHRVILKDSIGNILTPSGLDFELPTDTFTMLVLDGSNWRVVKPPSDAKFDTYMPDPLLWSAEDDDRILVANVVSEGGTFQNDILDAYADNMQAAWPMNELLGNRYDGKGDNDLIQTGQVASVGGKDGYAAWFDGDSANYLSCTNFLGTTGTISFWMQASSAMDATGNILYLPSGDELPPLFYITYNDLEGKLIVGVSIGGALYGELEATVAASEWVHVAYVWSPAGRRLYINGTEADTDTAAVSLISSETLKMGAAYKGALDQFYVWDAILSEEAIGVLSGDDGGGGASFVVSSAYVLSEYKVSDLLPANVIDDEAGEAILDKTWSAAKLTAQFDRFSFIDTESITSEDSGKPVIAYMEETEFGFTDPLIQATLDDLTSHFDLNERSGPRYSAVGDLSLTPAGTIEQITGVNGLAALFDGAANLSASSFLGAAGTMSFWFYVNADATGTNYLMELISSEDDSIYEGDTKAFIAYNVTTSTLRFCVYVDGLPMDLEAVCTKGAWHHVCITWTDGSPGVRKLYLDGVLKDSETSTLAISEGDTLRFGNALKGRMDTLQTWQAVMTEEVVTALYNSGEGVELVRGTTSFILADNPMSYYDSHIADATVHRSINDSGESATDIWSAARILEEIDTARIFDLDLLALQDHSRIVSVSVEATDFGFQDETLDASNASLTAFNLNERAGTRRSANTEHTLEPVGTVEACTGPDRYAVLFDADPTAYLQASSQLVGDTGSISLWFMISPSDSAGSYLFRVFKDDGYGDPEGLMHMYLLYSGESKTLRFGTVVEGIYMDLESDELESGEWINVVCTWASGARKMYINGVLAEEDELPVSVSGADTLRFGEDLLGRLDAVYIWSLVLSQGQVTLLQNHFYVDTASHLELSELHVDDVTDHMTLAAAHMADAEVHNGEALIPTIGLADSGKLAQFYVDPASAGFNEATLDAKQADLLAVFPFLESSGNRDSYINSEVFVPSTSEVQGVTGKYGIGLLLSELGETLSSTNLFTGTEGTLSFWFKPEATCADEAFLVRWLNANEECEAYIVYSKLTYTVRFGAYVPDESTGFLHDIEGVVLPGVWNLVTLTWDGDVKKLYINGSLADSAAVLPFSPADQEAILLGGDFIGRVDEMYVWSSCNDGFAPLLWNSGTGRFYSRGTVTLVAAADAEDRNTSFTIDSSALKGTPGAEPDCGEELTLGDASVDCVSFPQSLNRSIEFKFIVPADWAGGAMTLTLYWKAGGAGSIQWRSQYCVYSSGASSFVYTTAETKTAAVADDSLQKTILAFLPEEGEAVPGTIVFGRLYRLGASDSLAGRAYLLSVEVGCKLTPDGN